MNVLEKLTRETSKGDFEMAVAILCEKPSQRMHMAAALGGTSGNYKGEQYFTTNLLGHVYEFKKPDKQVDASLAPTFSSWSVGYLPWDETVLKWLYDKKPKVDDVVKTAKAVIAKCDEIAIATDWDASGEGDLLAWEFILQNGFSRKKITRLRFVDESPSSMRAAFQARVPASTQDANYMKAMFRSQWDFLSMQFTRVATAYGDGRSVLRQGRLKSAITYLIGQQEDLANGYKKVPYYQNRFVDENGVVYTSPEEPTYPNKDDVPKAYQPSPVACDKKEMKRKAPPMFWTLSTLSAKVSSEGIKPAVTLKLVQSMYEDQVVSYPRTDDHTVTPQQFNDMLPIVDKIASVVGVDPSILTHRQARSTHVQPKGAHGANRPGPKVPMSLAALDAKYGKGAGRIYELLAKSYLASMAEDYEYESQKGHVVNYPKFIGTTSVPKAAGWKAVFGADLDDEDEAGKGIGTHADPFVYEGFPPKPKAPTLTWLMAQLEKRDIGTGSTRTAAISVMTNTKDPSYLVDEKRGKLSLTECGRMSYYLLPGTYIGSLDITKQLQDEMEDVGSGKLSAAACLAKVQDMVRHDIEVMKKNGEDMRGRMGISYNPNNNNGGNGGMDDRFIGKWKGKDVHIKKLYSGHEFTDDEIKQLLNGDEITIDAKSAKGTDYRCNVKIDNCSFQNGKGETVKYIGISRTGFANDSSGIPKSFCGHEFTQDERSLLEEGETIALVNCVSKKGNTFDCHASWGDDPDNPGKKKLNISFD